MVNRSLITSLLLAAIASAIVAGCSSGESVMPHSATEQKAMDAYKTMTPQQRIEYIQKGPMPAAAKEAMIKKIKADNGLQ